MKSYFELDVDPSGYWCYNLTDLLTNNFFRAHMKGFLLMEKILKYLNPCIGIPSPFLKPFRVIYRLSVVCWSWSDL